MFFATMGSMPRTKIICTIGPASRDETMLKKLVDAGMGIARLNLSHGTLTEHESAIQIIRKINPKIRILADLQGPRIRTGKLKNKIAKLKLKLEMYGKGLPGSNARGVRTG